LAGVFGAIAALVGLAERAHRGHGLVVESPMVGAGLATTAEQVIDYSRAGHLHGAMGNKSPLIDQDVFACAGDDNWVAISIPDASARAAVADVIGAASSAELAAWCATRSVDDATAALSARGVPVAPVLWAHQIVDNPQLVDRGFFERVDHPICGDHPVVSWPARFAAGPGTWNRTPSPTLGQHNREILAELGYEPEAVDALYVSEVVAEGVLSSRQGW